jgi:uncharacterized protein DUF397
MAELKWRKSSRSDDLGGNCVEVADLGEAVGVRDSKDPGAGHLVVGRAAFRELVAAAKAS